MTMQLPLWCNEIGNSLASKHAQALFDLLGLKRAPQAASDHPALGWRRSGLMEITGRADGTALVAPVALTAAADGAMAALKSIMPGAALPENGSLLLGERARLLSLQRQGAVSANGACRLVEASDGRIALNLPRIEDWDLMPALFGEAVQDWATVMRLAKGRARADLLGQGRLLGLAVAPDAAVTNVPAPFTVEYLGHERLVQRTPLVIDLSGLWAGPLAGSLLQAGGARVIKVESTQRPDGARGGNQPFFDLLNAGKASVTFNFANARDVVQLRELIRTADIVIESSRPRALEALGIYAKEQVERGATWISITAHGRAGDAANWIGFGDDAAVAGGLSAAMHRGWGQALFAGDAIADPLTGITAAVAGWASWRMGGGRLVSVALADVIAHACQIQDAGPSEVKAWQELAETDTQPLYKLRKHIGTAQSAGANNAMARAGNNSVRRDYVTKNFLS